MEALLKQLAPQVLGVVVRKYRDFAACEDAVQEALLAAAQQWPRDGTPAHPKGWLVRVAAWKMTDRVRGEVARKRREEQVVSLVPAGMAEIEIDGVGDDTLAMLFACCHPALSTPSQIALTLRAVGGLTTAEIARAFLVPEATMAQRISRAKASVADAGIEMPEAAERAQRMVAVLHVLYLIFNQGYTDQRTDLATEAIRLTRAVRRLLPDDLDVAGLLALMLLTDARRGARGQDQLIPLDEQDRSRWDRALIAEGTALVADAMPAGGAYAIQAAIAALHDEAPSHAATDWPQIAALYGVLEAREPGPLVTLSRAIAVAMVDGPAAGLALLDRLGDVGYRGTAARGHLLALAGDLDGARACFRAAAAKTTSTVERDFLLRKASSTPG